MKKIVGVFILSFLLALGIFWGVEYYLTIRSQKGALQVTSSPQSRIYLNNVYVGETPLCECQSSDMVVPGDYTIRLVPLDTELQEFQEKITVSQGVLTVIDRQFGKNGQSEGSIISLAPLSDRTKTQLLVVSFPQGANILLDDQNIGKTPLLYNNPTVSDHDLKVSKDGYNDKEIRIHTPTGYKLTVAAYLSTNTTGLNASTGSSSASLNPTAPSATPTPKNSVTILDTPTGFLRVRENPSVSANEVGEATPRKTYPMVDEQNGWYKITLDDGTVGWVSSQYAKKE